MRIVLIGALPVLALIAAGAAATAWPSAAVAAPPNDDFPGTTITELPITTTVDTSGATDQPSEQFCLPLRGLAVWYSFTPATDATLRAELTGSGDGGFVDVYTGVSLGDLTCMANGLYAPPPRELNQPAVFAATAGVTYHFQVGIGGYPPLTGVLTFNLSDGALPANDDFPGTEITEVPFEDTVDTAFATWEADEVSFIGPTVWYNYTPSRDITLWADTFEGSYRAEISLQDPLGDRPPGFSSAEYSECETADRVLFRAAAGETVYFQVGGRPMGSTGTLAFRLRESGPEDALEPSPYCVEESPVPIGSAGALSKEQSGSEADAGALSALPQGGGSRTGPDRWVWPVILVGALTVAGSAALALAKRRA